MNSNIIHWVLLERYFCGGVWGIFNSYFVPKRVRGMIQNNCPFILKFSTYNSEYVNYSYTKLIR